MNSLKVELFENGRSMGSHVVDEKQEVILGSAKTADLIVLGKGIAAIHALVRVGPHKAISLYDLGSQSGTYVGNNRVVEMLLPQGTRFRIGNREVRVSLVEEQLSPEEALFWKKDPNGKDLLHTSYLSQGRLMETHHLTGKGKLRIHTEWGVASIAQARNRSATVTLTQVLKGEIYSLSGQLVEAVEGQEFTVGPDQKLRLFANDSELQIYRSAIDARFARGKAEKDAYLQQRSFMASFALFLLLASGLYITQRHETIPEETVFPKSEYTRVTMESSAPQGGPVQEQAAAESKEEAKTASAAPAAPAKPSATQNAVNQMLNKLIQRADAAVPMQVGTAGSQTVRVASSSSKFNEMALSGGVSGKGVNAQAISADLAGGGGAGKGLNGFASKGIAGSGGAGVGTGQGAGGFGLNLGSDEAEAIGGLDKALIAAVVQANLGQIKHCYEKQLLVDNSIAGKVVSGWTIDGSGSVIATSIKKTTLNSAAVEDCIQSRIKNWKFPQPKGGGKVLVSYPFLFKALN